MSVPAEQLDDLEHRRIRKKLDESLERIGQCGDVYVVEDHETWLRVCFVPTGYQLGQQEVVDQDADWGRVTRPVLMIVDPCGVLSPRNRCA